jgi:hypothetical protein
MLNSLVSGLGWVATPNNILGDPHLVNATGDDDHLAADSPAVNGGTTVGAPSYDLEGVPRGTQPDIGAFEFGAVPRPLLTVDVEQFGGSGTVISSPVGVSCGVACGARFDPNTTIALTAKPDRGSRFLGWQGGCSGRAPCTITLNSPQWVTARFGP